MYINGRLETASEHQTAYRRPLSPWLSAAKLIILTDGIHCTLPSQTYSKDRQSRGSTNLSYALRLRTCVYNIYQWTIILLYYTLNPSGNVLKLLFQHYVATVNAGVFFGLHYIISWSILVDRNNTTVTVWFNVLVSVLDDGPDVILPDILPCFEIQHLFDTRNRRHTTCDWHLGGVHVSAPLWLTFTQIPPHFSFIYVYVYLHRS